MNGFLVLFAVGVCMTLIGCASTGVQVNPARVQQFKEGVTTQADAVAALGRPTSVLNTNGRTYMIWSGMHAQVRLASFIPLVGLFAGGADVQASSVTLEFRDGVLASSSTQQTEVGSRNGIYESMNNEQPRKVE